LYYHPRIKTLQIKVEVANLQMKLQENKQLSFRPKKDQKANKANWKRNVKKTLRLQGKEYLDYKGKTVAERSMNHRTVQSVASNVLNLYLRMSVKNCSRSIGT